MSLKRTPPNFSTSKPAKERILTQDSDTTSEKIYSDDPENVEYIAKRYKRRHSDMVSYEIKELLSDLKQQQTAKFNRLESDMLTLKELNLETQKSIEFLAQKYDDLLLKINKVQQENLEYQDRIKILVNKIEYLERNAKTSSIELRNIPITQPENQSSLCKLVRNMSEVLNVSLQDNEIRDIYRIKKKLTSNSPSPIVIDFTTTLMKDNFIRSVSSFNKENKDKKLNTSHLNIDGPPKPIYISECLTTKTRRLHYLARQYTKKNKYSNCWTAHGKVFVRQKDGIPAIRIDSEEDFCKLSFI